MRKFIKGAAESGLCLIKSVMIVWQELKNRDAGSDDWLLVDVKFAELRDRIRWHFMQHALQHSIKVFPYSDEYVKQAWISYRKTTSDQKAELVALLSPRSIISPQDLMDKLEALCTKTTKT